MQYLQIYGLVCAYTLLCALVANKGTQRRVGFWGALIICLLITPVPVALFLFIFDRKKTPIEAPGNRKTAEASKNQSSYTESKTPIIPPYKPAAVLPMQQAEAAQENLPKKPEQPE